ncbi:MAG: hypothetical protein R3F54_32440 [Alphaproteobacteria bacterium]
MSPLVSRALFDPYAFNLLDPRACLAAIRDRPVITGRHRRKAQGRLGSENDDRINHEVDHEIRHLDEKPGHLLIRWWQWLGQSWRIQLRIMEFSTGAESMKRDASL